MIKQVHRYKDIRDKITKAIDTLCDPVRETMSPKGRNVIFENESGNFVSTNDGVTIAKSISVEDPVENAIISVLKNSSLKTNTEVGDGTSTSLKLSQVLIKEALKLVDNGWNQMDVKNEIERVGGQILDKLKKKAIKVKGDKDLENIARISSNNDEEIAKNVVKVVKVVGEDGMVFLEPNNKPETELVEDNGFMVGMGLFASELRNNPRANSATYVNVPVLITDKRLYYEEEVETILKTVLLAGHKSVVIVARDFVGKAVNQLIGNHAQGNCSVLMVKEPRAEKNSDALYDLATYLGGKVISDKTGSLVNKLKIEDFVMCDKAFADGVKTIITTKKKKNSELDNRIAAIKKELEKDKDNDDLKKRLASLTNGMVTIKIGGHTQIETIERIYRYEDAVHATRAALKDGFLVGGGVTMLSIYGDLKTGDSELAGVFRKYCEANVHQIAENCGEHADSIVKLTIEANKGSKNWTKGYNAVTGQIEDLLVGGIVDPYKVTEMAVRSSISIASQIISSNFLIIHKAEDDKESK